MYEQKYTDGKRSNFAHRQRPSLSTDIHLLLLCLGPYFFFTEISAVNLQTLRFLHQKTRHLTGISLVKTDVFANYFAFSFFITNI